MLGACGHTFCGECFHDYFKSLIEEQNKDHKLKCPQFGCETKPTQDEVKNIISEDCFKKFQKFQLNRKVATDKNLLFCSKIGCENVLNVMNAQKNMLLCSECKQKTCKKCKQEFHGNKNCEDADAKRYENWVGGLIIHKCPNCGCQVEKNEGCPMMDCAICDYAWCWSCGMNTKNRLHDVFGIYCQLYNNIAIEKWSPFKKGTLIVLLVTFFPILYLISCLSGGFYLVSECCCGCFTHHCLTSKRCVNILIMTPSFIFYALFSIIVGLVTFSLTVIPMALILVLFLFKITFRWCFSSRKVK